MRIFLDTNVLASALMGRGLCQELLDRALLAHEVLLGVPVREELARILPGKFKVPQDLLAEVLATLDRLEQVPASDLSPPGSIPDPDDVKVVACALAARADVLVTGDKALLTLGRTGDMSILAPRQLYEMLLRAG